MAVFYALWNGILNTIQNLGYFGVFLGMTIESSLFPFPSEIILIPAGNLVALGHMSFFIVFLMGLLGSLVGATINYFLAFFIGRTLFENMIDRYGKFLFLNKKKLAKSDAYFLKHGEITTFVGRLIPGVRQIISLPAGFSKMHFGKFLLYTSLGAGIWTAILIYIGYVFGKNWAIIEPNLNLLLIILSLLIVLIYIILKKKHKQS